MITQDWIVTTLNEAITENSDKDDAAEDLYTYLVENAGTELQPARDSIRGFETRLYNKWRHPFNLLKVFIELNIAVGRDLRQYYGGDEDEHQFDVLSRLHARGCQLSNEIFTLISSGYADGAFARWRSLYELAAVMYVLSEADNETALRFKKHKRVDDYEQYQSYKPHLKDLGHSDLEEDQIRQLNKDREELEDEYGPEFTRRYGWAEHLFPDGATSLGDLVEAADLQRHFAHYQFASDRVHPTWKGTIYRLGVPDTVNEDNYEMVAGPTNYGFTDPAQYSAICLYRATEAYITLETNPPREVCLEVLAELVDDIANGFYYVDRMIEMNSS